ncbi:MAG: tRNA (guanosine(37)-N1)-methyltransferase TrmD [Gemmatimonadetes bacterium]|nr:tRNA (guanosine(37)-N1)-methyltransferase TrmD [Gemmatimonadota bacterium]
MRITVFTIFPELIEAACAPSILGAAIERGLLDVRAVDPRQYTEDRHRKVDDIPFGGGAGMVMMAQPIATALDTALASEESRPRIVFLTPGGVPFHQDLARDLAREDAIFLVAGRYKGVDDRVVRAYATDEISIGDYVLSGGELPALVVIDAVMRLLPGALGDFASAEDDSIHSGLLEVPQYTRPREFRGATVPEVLLSGHHENIRRWRRRQALARTLARRPELLARAELTAEDRKLLREIEADLDAGRETEASGGTASE